MLARGKQACRITRVVACDKGDVEDFLERISTTLTGFGLQQVENLDSTCENKIVEAQDDAGTLLH